LKHTKGFFLGKDLPEPYDEFIMRFNMATAPKQFPYCLSVLGRLPSGLDVHTVPHHQHEYFSRTGISPATLTWG